MRRRYQIIGAIAVGLGAIALAALSRPGPETAMASPSPVAQEGSATGHYTGDGFSLDYPASWAFYPMPLQAMSHFTVAGYLASQPIDTSAICTSTPNSTSCNFRNYELAPGQAAVELAYWGWPMDDPVAFWDQPTEGRRLVVDGMPAIVADDLGDPGTVVRTWKIARPTMFDNWLQLDAGMRGPAQSGALDAVISSIRFDPRPQPLNPAQANQIGNAALAALRADDAEGFACFPPVGQSVVASITAAPGAPLRQPLTATCSTTIAGTDIGFWRMVLVVGWGDDLPGAGFRYTTVQWLLPDGTLSGRSSGGDDALPFCCRG